MNPITINTKYAFVLIDVVFGVIIAIPLISLPENILRVISEPLDPVEIQILLLLISSLLFCACYWLELHGFLSGQERLNKCLNINEVNDITPKQSRVFLGAVIMITSLAAIINYATLKSIEAFLVANIIFWVFDMLGSREVKKNYKPYRNRIIEIKETNPVVYEWYERRIISRYYYIYGLINTLFFFIALMLYIFVFDRDSKFGLSFGIILFFVTLVRHYFSISQGFRLTWQSRN